MDFSIFIISWYSVNKRDLPWRNTRDPYLIWISEIMLQQTRVNQCISYFERFIGNFPTISALANASEQEVLKNWEGLGYYSRARNLHFSAKFIMNNLNGEFPQTFSEIIKLKGIGTYTASAIASFAFKEVVPVVDGNVFRVLSRVYGLEYDIAQTKNHQYFINLAAELIPSNAPDVFNQAIMEFGALQCTPQNPNCEICELNQYCYAFVNNKVNFLPIKISKLKVKNREIDYLVFIHNDETYIQLREEEDIWKGLFEFIRAEQINLDTIQVKQLLFENTVQHKLTHLLLSIRFRFVRINENLSINKFKKVKISELEKYPFPIVIKNQLINMGKYLH